MKRGLKRIFGLLVIVTALFTAGCFGEKGATKNEEEKYNSTKIEVLSVKKGDEAGQIKYFDLTQTGEDSEKIKYAAESFTMDNKGNIYILNGYEKTIKVYNDGIFVKTISIANDGMPIDIYFDDEEGNIKVLDNQGVIATIDGEDTVKTSDTVDAAASTLIKRGTEESDLSYCVKAIIRGEDGTAVAKYEDNIYVETGASKRSKTADVDTILNSLDIKFFTEKGYKSFIGYDTEKNIYILTTEMIANTTGDMDIEQKVIKFSSDLKYESEVILVNEKEFAVANKNVFVSGKGEVYQLLNLPKEVKIYKLNLNKAYNTNAPVLMNYLKSIESAPLVGNEDPTLKRSALSLTRTEMYDRAAAMANLSWTYTPSKNGDKGSYLTLPSQCQVSITKTMTGVPYCWGGWNSTSTFKTNIANSYMAGNVYCDGGWKANTAGTDCSGFISVVIGNSSKLGTSMIATSSLFTTVAYSSLVKMDALNDSGSHVMFYLSTLSDGTVKTVESTTGTANGGIQGVKFYTRSLSGLKNDGYVPKRYVNIKAEPVVNTTIAYTVPSSGMEVGNTVKFSGTCSTDIVKITRLVAGSTVRDVNAPVSGSFSFDVLFTNAGSKTLTVYGYTASGKSVSVSKTFTVKSKISLTVPTTGLKVGSTAIFKGTCSSDIVKITRLVSGSTVRDVNAPVSGTFSFDVLFSSSGSKTLTVYGYDADGTAVSISKTFTVAN